MSQKKIRHDLEILSDLIEPKSRVMDIGCGDGQLLMLLEEAKQCDARGLELDQDGVNACVADGLSVMQGNADTDLANYPDQAFDYVILSKTIQATHRPDLVLKELLRIGKNAIVSFPNFGHWRVRASLGFGGKMPVTKNLNYSWYATPNIHFCTLQDFIDLCDELDVKIEKQICLNKQDEVLKTPDIGVLNNLFADQAIFLLSSH